MLNSTDNVVNVHTFEKTKFSFTLWLCDDPVFSRMQFYDNYHFFRKLETLANELILFIAFFNFLSSGILFIKFDALTAREIIFKQHMKYVIVKFFVCF